MGHQKEICVRKKKESISSRDRLLKRAFYSIVLVIGIAYISFGLICPYFHKEMSCKMKKDLNLKKQERKGFSLDKKPNLSLDLLLFSEKLEKKLLESKDCLHK